MPMKGWTLHLVEPSHFHAALLLQNLDKRVIGPIFVHGTSHWDETPFLAWVASLESGNWDPDRLKIVRSQDPIAEIIRQGGGSLALLAGQNQLKADRILRFLIAKVPVICDKPLWVNLATGKGLEGYLRSANQDVFLDDCMTERLEPAFELQRLLLSEGLPGFEIRQGSPNRVCFHLSNTHNLAKTVAGVRVGREPAFFQTETYGDPFADVGIHLVDHYLRLLTALGSSIKPLEKDPGRVESQWETIDTQTLSISSEIGAIPFPIKQEWQGGSGPIRAKIETKWLTPTNPPSEEGQSAVIHGSCGALVVSPDPLTGSMVLDFAGLPVGERMDWGKILGAILGKLPDPWTKTQIIETRFGIRMIPPHVPGREHATRFPLVFKRFLDRIHQNRPLNPFERQKLLLKYSITSGAPRTLPNPQSPSHPYQ